MVDAQHILLEPTEKKDTRSGFGQGLLEAGQQNANVVGLCADLTGSLKMNAFKDAFPDRFFQVGIAEANMMGVAAGMTIGGKIPFTGTFANFSTGRVYDQIRQSIAYSEKNVKICASHAGLTLGEDGATHQILEDIGMMAMLPNMTVIVPADYEQTRQATLAIADHHGPVYLRFGRPKVPVFVKSDAPFEIGKIQRVISGSDLTIAACGHLVWESVQAAIELAKDGITVDVLNVHTIKPLDEPRLWNRPSAQVLCSLPRNISETVAWVALWPKPSASIAPPPWISWQWTIRLARAEPLAQLMEKYGLDAKTIVTKAKALVQR